MRQQADKKKSSSEFKRNVSRTKAANVQAGPMRGGWRL